jgi:integrase
MAGRALHKLDDAHISALQDFGFKGYYWDTELRGLRVRIGSRKTAWSYFREHSKGGQRKGLTTCVPLGEFPSITYKDARARAEVIRGEEAGGTIRPGRRASVKLSAAFDQYLDHLERKAAKAGKPPRWKVNVAALRKLFVRFEGWTLRELSSDPAAVAKWHQQLVIDHGGTSANHSARVLRALYRRAARADLSLSKADLPVAAVDWANESPKQDALAPKDFPKWAEAWRALENDTHRAYALHCLLSGQRPGEASRLRWSDVQPKARLIVVENAKAGNKIFIPLTVPITRALKLARDNRVESEPLIFPACGRLASRLELPAGGMMLRHTWASIAATLNPPVPEVDRHLLLGHALDGVSRRYLIQIQLASGASMRESQRRISRRMIELLGLKLGTDF